MKYRPIGYRQERLVTGLLIGHCTFKQQFILWVSWKALCDKCGQTEKSCHHRLCECPDLVRYRSEIFSSVLSDLRRASLKMVIIIIWTL